MTTEEAKTKWCPMARTAAIITNESDEITDIKSAYNKVSQPEGFIVPASCLCIASECMMWRWNEYLTGIPNDKQTRTGYCGLGGKPL